MEMARKDMPKATLQDQKRLCEVKYYQNLQKQLSNSKTSNYIVALFSQVFCLCKEKNTCYISILSITSKIIKN